jgi:hypothetical protein
MWHHGWLELWRQNKLVQYYIVTQLPLHYYCYDSNISSMHGTSSHTNCGHEAPEESIYSILLHKICYLPLQR